MKAFPDLEFELVLHDDSLVSGTRTQHYSKDRFERYAVRGIFRKQDATIYIVEEKADVQNADDFGDAGSYTMKLRIFSGFMRFEGKWKNALRGPFTSYSSKVWVDKPLSPGAPVKVEKAPARNTLIAGEILLDSSYAGTIKIEIIDDAQVDNDAISIYLNDTLIAHRKKLSALPLTFTVDINEDQPEQVITIMAESEGTIPPCTALMKVTPAHGSYSIPIKSDIGNNSSVVIKLRQRH